MMNIAPLIPVILCGGVGSRLWPLSRAQYPKQFIQLIGDLSLFQATVARAKAVEPRNRLRVVCNQEHRFMTADQLLGVDAEGSTILLEPEGRNTAPAVAVSALDALKESEDAVLLVLPADHLLRDVDTFSAAVEAARVYAEQGAFVAFGVKPQGPETGYGYLQQGKPTAESGRDGKPAYEVSAFVEKPDIARAEAYLKAGSYWWNSGMFMFGAKAYLNALQSLAPEMLGACSEAYEKSIKDLDFVRLSESAFKRCPSDSIDYAVMEKVENRILVPLDTAWSDVGSWRALWDVEADDNTQNVLVGDVLSEDCEGCYIHGGRRLVAALGLRDQIIVETPDAILVAPKDRSQDVKQIVDKLIAQGRVESVQHRKVFRPWGTYEVIDEAERFQVKRITVKPGQKLSLQMHHHRAEHWIVVKGSARVTRDDEVFLLAENESTFIPLGAKHRLENPGRIPLELIEVQSGSYLGEDDITRFEDSYGRSENC